jgi:Flp pilus assembly protein TadB
MRTSGVLALDFVLDPLVLVFPLTFLLVMVGISTLVAMDVSLAVAIVKAYWTVSLMDDERRKRQHSSVPL